jgi:tripartite-type tricarboxylate transporter receptor subunit TctC
MTRYVSISIQLSSFVLLAALIGGATQAQAQSYPMRPVRIISDSAPGSAIDTNLRTIADGLSERWGQQVVIENRPGAGGAISATVAAEAAPDGYTIYAPALSVFLTIPGKAPNLPVQLPRDFTAIGLTAEQPMSIGINPKLGINTLPELIAQAKKQPGSISFAVTGVGRLTHLTGELLQLRSDIKLQMVPYTGGSALAVTDIMAGRVALVIEGYAGLAGAYQTGQLKALAIASAKRLPDLPNVPTVAETLPGFVAVGWQCVVAPVGTPPAIVRKISDDLRAVLVRPEIKDKIAARGGYVHPAGPAEAEAFVRSQQELWQPGAGAGGPAVQAEVTLQHIGNKSRHAARARRRGPRGGRAVLGLSSSRSMAGASVPIPKFASPRGTP